MTKFKEILKKNIYSRDDIIYLISQSEHEQLLFEKAYEVKKKYVGTNVYFRGLIELSNICTRNCFYCGIRKGNKNIDRFQLSKEDIVEKAIWAYEAGYGSAVLQGGERSDPEFINFIENVLKLITHKTNGKAGITLSLGEQTEETYTRWLNAGAHRYLLRIESSNPDIYHNIHPDTDKFSSRIAALKLIQKCGYQTGTGVMIGLPQQTYADLADDILFFKENDIDMIGMGPFIPHHDTPMANAFDNFDQMAEEQLKLALRVIAITRIIMKDINIASSTALQALDSKGRERGLLAGANIIMPNVTDTQYRKGYQLYDGKPGLDENCNSSRINLEKSIHNTGEKIGYNMLGDSPHFFERIKNK